MKSTTARGTAAVVGLFLTVFSAHAASAQWHGTGIAVAEYDTKQTLLLLGGLSMAPGGLGIKPTVGIQAYTLGYGNNGAPRTNVFVVEPYVGLHNNYDGGQVGANLGYSFANKAVGGPGSVTSVANVAADKGSGVVLSGSWDQWGRNNDPNGYQVLGSYNFGSKSVWSRGRVTRRVTPPGPSQRRFGAELAYLAGTGYSAFQPGAVLEFHDPTGNILGLGAGMKFFGNGGGSAVYFKAEGVIPFMR